MDGRWRIVDGGRRTVDGGWWTVDSGQRTADGEQRQQQRQRRTVPLVLAACTDGCVVGRQPARAVLLSDSTTRAATGAGVSCQRPYTRGTVLSSPYCPHRTGLTERCPLCRAVLCLPSCSPVDVPDDCPVLSCPRVVLCVPGAEYACIVCCFSLTHARQSVIET